MARFEFRLPDIGEGIAEAEIVAWHVAIGDEIKEDQQLADMMTDKATVEMESPVAGRVIALAGEVGDQIAIGSTLVVIETSADAAAEAAQHSSAADVCEIASPKQEAVLADGMADVTPGLEEAVPSAEISNKAVESPPARPEPVEGLSSPSTSDRREGQGFDKLSPSGSGVGSKALVLASPAVRQRARDLGIDLSQVKAESERIRHADLDAYLMYSGGSLARPAAARQDEVVKVVGLRRKIAENMQEAKRRIPHFTLVEEYDVTALEQTRAMMNADRGDNPKLTMLPFLITAMTRVLADYPQINARYDDDAQIITRSGAVHMGVATQTPNGLMVPVIRNAGALDPWTIAREIIRLAEGARTGKAARDELSGSTITISSLGPMGGITSTPVINRPEVAIIAVNKVEEKPVVIGGKIGVRKRMNLSLSCDHRVVDGWDAANFLQDMKALIENPLKLLSMR
jgi:2-oxoisovalerate dehydrogenase E2 component (dihydrolipoyl transacylase)